MTKFSNIRSTLWQILRAILKAEFVLRLKLDKYFLHVIYTFVVCLLLIWLSLSIEKTMGKVESNQKIITELRYENSRLNYELAKMSSRTEVEQRLKELGSKITEPTEPATTIYNGNSRK